MTHKTLADAIRAGVPDGQRVYEAEGTDGIVRFAIAKGPTSAAMQFVQPRLVKQSEMLAAYKLLVEKPASTGKGE